MILKNREKGERFQKISGRRSFRHSKSGISHGNRESWHVWTPYKFTLELRYLELFAISNHFLGRLEHISLDISNFCMFFNFLYFFLVMSCNLYVLEIYRKKKKEKKTFPRNIADRPPFIFECVFELECFKCFFECFFFTALPTLALHIHTSQVRMSKIKRKLSVKTN